MKKLFTKLTTPLSLLLLLTVMVSSCKKSKQEVPIAPVAVSGMSGTIDGKAINVSESGLSTTYFNTPGEAVSSLMTGASLDANGSKMEFFIPDVKSGTFDITPKLGTSSNPGNPFLKNQASTSTTTQTYISYTSSGSVYFAISGSITVTVDDSKISVKWSISFKDAAGRVFTSAGDFTIYFYKAVTKPKSEVKDPTPVAAKPTIDNIAPTAGMAGDEVAIAGTNFSTTLSENVVKFNGIAATVKTATATKLTVTVPTSSTGAIAVKVGNSENVTGPTFTYVLPPTITGITPLSAKVGDAIVITGTNFSATSVENVVTINGVQATVTLVSGTSITVTVPTGATSGPIALKVRGKDATAGAGVSTAFVLVTPATITSLSVSNGPIGTNVTINGTNFGTSIADNVVTFNGTAANVLSASSTVLNVTVPTGATTGLVVVKVKGVDALVTVATPAINIFTVTAPATSFGTPGQAYVLFSPYYTPNYKTYDNDGNLWLVDGTGAINKMSYNGGDPQKTILPSAFSGFTTLTSYLCRGLTRDANGGMHAYIYGSGPTGNPTFVVSITKDGVVSKDFESQFYEKSSGAFAFTVLSEPLMISTRYGSSDIIRLKPDGGNEIYLKGGTGADNTLGGLGAYDMCYDGGALYVLTYVPGTPNTNMAIYKFDSNKNRTLVATLNGGGYVDGPIANAKFSNVTSIAVSGSSIYIGDQGNLRIRKLDTRSSNIVSTFAGSGTSGITANGAALSVNFSSIAGLLVDGSHGVLYNLANTNTNVATRIAY